MSGVQHHRRALMGCVAAMAAGLGGCQADPMAPLRLGAHAWPGYELLFLARTLGALRAEVVHLAEMPSASASLRGLATGSLDAAGLTLDEVLTGLSRGIELVVVGVLDVSLGADVVLARPGLASVSDLRGRRIGVESSATGAVMLDAMLSRHGLQLSDVRVVPVAFDEHEGHWLAGQVDALVTFEPISSRLQAAGARVLFSSAEVPGRIVDVLAVRRDALAAQAVAIRHALAGHFAGLEVLRAQPADSLARLAPRLGQPVTEVARAYSALQLPGLADNRGWLRAGGRLQDTAARLRTVMLAGGLLARAVDLDALASEAYLPAGAAA